MNAIADDFFTGTDLSFESIVPLVQESLLNAEDGELFLEYKEAEVVSFDDGRIRTANFDITKGFGLRSVVDELVGYAHSSDLSLASLKRACSVVQATQNGHQGKVDLDPKPQKPSLYHSHNPLLDMSFEQKVAFLKDADSFVRSQDERIRQVSLSLLGSWQKIVIIRPSGQIYSDIRPLVRVNFSVVMADGDRLESGYHGMGGRTNYAEFLEDKTWKDAARDAIRLADVNLQAKEAPAGEMEVVLGAGWPGILLHEAIGHGLEGDFNRKKTSAFSGLIGKEVASKGVTIVDDGTLPNRRGSIHFDDEGTPSSCTTLIEDGTLVGYMQDRQNARLMGTHSTGNGRRESYAYAPMPRMTNTYMLAGDADPQEMVKSVKNGIYAVNFGGGQVDITSGKFVFTCTEAYKVENGQILYPIKGATLIGSGPESLKYITMVGNDLKLDNGVGTCGKAGQGVPVGVGQPSLKISQMTVGGTQQAA